MEGKQEEEEDGEGGFMQDRREVEREPEQEGEVCNLQLSWNIFNLNILEEEW